jgi:DNA-binding transcriptional ArsR family regulator
MSEPDNTPSDQDADATANALKAMAHPIRWKILCALGGSELTVGEIIEKVGTTQSNVSQHIDILRNKDIIQSRKDGNRVYCRVGSKEVQLLVDNMRTVFCAGR